MNNLIERIHKSIREKKVIFTDHAKDEADNDNFNSVQIFESIHNGEIIENYPLDRPYPSCLISGKTAKGIPIHSVLGYNKKTGYAVLITVYRPDPTRWINFKKRIKK